MVRLIAPMKITHKMGEVFDHHFKLDAASSPQGAWGWCIAGLPLYCFEPGHCRIT